MHHRQMDPHTLADLTFGPCLRPACPTAVGTPRHHGLMPDLDLVALAGLIGAAERYAAQGRTDGTDRLRARARGRVDLLSAAAGHQLARAELEPAKAGWHQAAAQMLVDAGGTDRDLGQAHRQQTLANARIPPNPGRG